ncbi:MAG: hypothetical protein CMJ58_03990 [Planctomycetaceae bacterium]|nr:hypothetical protein [Planctomycetaceae bacterium]
MLLSLCLTALALPTTLQAAEPLRWKFTAGDVQHYKMTQDMQMTIESGGQKMTTDMNQDLHMTWEINEVLDNGSAKMVQKINRMKMTMKMPGQTLEFDSANPDKAQGPLAAQVGPMFKALTSNAFAVTMSPRGEITDVEIPKELIEALKASPGAAAMGDLASEDGFKHLVQQGSLTLPEELTEGKQWTTKVDVKNPIVGTQTIETTYVYKGSRDVEGETMEIFAPSMVVDFAAGAGPVQMEVAGQESEGEILFNRGAGRLESSNINQGMDLKASAAGQESALKIDQKIKLQWISPEEAEKEAKQ